MGKPALELLAPVGFASSLFQNVAMEFQHFFLGQKLAEMSEGFVRNESTYLPGISRQFI